MMKQRIISIFLFSLVGFLLTGCQKEQDDLNSNAENLEFPDQEGWSSTVTSTRNGMVEAIIQYGHMQRFKKRKVVELDQGVVVDFFNEQGKHTSKLTSKKGRLDEATNNIEALGNVVVVSDTGITLTTERLRWDNSIEKIVSNDSVTIITTEQDTFKGNGFESDRDLENWHITAFSGRTNRGLDLNFELNKKKTKSGKNSKRSKIDTTHGF